MGFQLTDNDIEIIKHIYNHRLLTINHLTELTKRSDKTLYRRLSKLVNNHYLYRLERPNQKHIYLIGKESILILVEKGTASKELIEWRMRHHELKDLFLKHLLMISDIHTALEIASRDGRLKLARWKQGRELNDSVAVREHGEKIKLPIQPDAFFTLQDTTRPAGYNQVHFFLEADRSTTTHQRFQRKIKAYYRYFYEGGHTKKHNIKTFRVATIALTRERALNLCEAIKEIIPHQSDRRFYLFACLEQFKLNPRQVLEEIFFTPRETDKHPDGRILIKAYLSLFPRLAD